MKLPDLDPSGGPLEIRETLIEYDGPQVFVARNVANAVFVAIHGPDTDGVDTWLFVRVSPNRLGQLKNSSITLREIATRYARGPAAIVNYIGRYPTFQFIEVDLIPEKMLPHYDSYLGDSTDAKLPMQYAESDLIGSYDPLDEHEELPLPMEMDLWEFDPRTINYLKSRMTPLNVVAKRRGRLVADIVFSAGEARSDFPVPELGKILINMQKVLDSLGIGPGLATPKGRPSAALKRRTRLDAIATFPSSFGLRVEAHEGSLVEGASSEIAFSRFIDLLSSVADQQALQNAFVEHSTETKLYFGEVIKEIAKAGSSIRISTGSVHQDHVSHTAVPADAVANLAEQIAFINEQNEHTVIFEGRLKAVSLKTKFFLIENDDDSKSGRIYEELLPRISGAEINAWYRAQIKEKTILHELTGEVAIKSLLVSLEKLAPAS